jgi:hypothetical protein
LFLEIPKIGGRWRDLLVFKDKKLRPRRDELFFGLKLMSKISHRWAGSFSTEENDFLHLNAASEGCLVWKVEFGPVRGFVTFCHDVVTKIETWRFVKKFYRLIDISARVLVAEFAF